MTTYYVLLWIASILTCIFLISIIAYKVDCKPDWAYSVSRISGTITLCLWIGVLAFSICCTNNKFKYRCLLEDKIKAERTVEKYLIDHPELRELEVDEFGKIKE